MEVQFRSRGDLGLIGSDDGDILCGVASYGYCLGAGSTLRPYCLRQIWWLLFGSSPTDGMHPLMVGCLVSLFGHVTGRAEDFHMKRG